MRIALLGATGRTGAEFASQAEAAGHEIVAYVRRPQALTPSPRMKVVGGQIDDEDALTEAFAGCNAVAITLGPKIGQTSTPLMSVAVPAVIAAAKRAGVYRVVVLSALGAFGTFANTRYPYRFGCRTFLRGAFNDHKLGENHLLTSDLAWTTIHPGPLGNKGRTASPTIVDAATGFKMPGAPRTQRADVAAAMLAAINDPSTYGKRMIMTSATSA